MSSSPTLTCASWPGNDLQDALRTAPILSLGRYNSCEDMLVPPHVWLTIMIWWLQAVLWLRVHPGQQEEHGDEEEKEGVLHEETFHRNPSLKIPERPSRLHLAERTASHIWHRLPLLQVFHEPFQFRSCLVVMDHHTTVWLHVAP